MKAGACRDDQRRPAGFDQPQAFEEQDVVGEDAGHPQQHDQHELAPGQTRESALLAPGQRQQQHGGHRKPQEGDGERIEVLRDVPAGDERAAPEHGGQEQLGVDRRSWTCDMPACQSSPSVLRLPFCSSRRKSAAFRSARLSTT